MKEHIEQHTVTEGEIRLGLEEISFPEHDWWMIVILLLVIGGIFLIHTKIKYGGKK